MVKSTSKMMDHKTTYYFNEFIVFSQGQMVMLKQITTVKFPVLPDEIVKPALKPK